MLICLTYLLILFVTSVLAAGLKKTGTQLQKKIVMFLIVGLWTSFTLIWPVNFSGDRMNYATWFQKIYPNYLGKWNLIFSQDIEFGWVILNTYLSNIVHNVKIMFFIYSLFPNAAIFYLFYKQKYPLYRLNIIFGVTLLPFYSTYLCRQMFALGFVVLSYLAFQEKHNFKSIVWAVIALLFHQTAVIYLLFLGLMFILKNRNHEYVAVGILLMIIPIAPIISKIVLDTFRITKWSIGSHVSFGIDFFKCLPYLAIFILNLFTIRCKREEIQYEMATFLCAFFWMFSIYGYWLYRLNIYFLPVFCIGIENIRERYLLCEQGMRINSHNKRGSSINICVCYIVLCGIFIITIREMYLMTRYF